MKTYNKLFLLGVLLLSVNAFSCKNGFLPNSIGDAVTPSKNPDKVIECPANVRATNGGKQKIILSWDSVQKAVKYYIYAANTPFESFIKIGETTDLSYTYKIMPGLTRCLKVTAVTYQGVESGDSIIVTGSSLACPSISSITTDTDDNGSVTTVYWYMENADQYQENLRYEIYCYNGTAQEAFGQLDGSLTDQMNYTFNNLPQNSSFDFQVIAYLNSEQNDTESSEIMNALTAAKQTPDAVSDLKATKATSLDSITLTFSLPEPSYVKTGVTAGTETFTQYPLFFKLFRRVAGTETWSVIANHLYCDGTIEGPKENDTPIKIESSDDAVTKLQKQDKINAWFDQTYVAGNEIVYTDKDLDSKTEYEYKIQSYIDNYKNSQITSDKISVSKVVSGFTAAIPSATAVWNGYQFNDPEAKDFKLSASINFNLSWDNFGEEENYKYVLKTTRTTVPETEEETPQTFKTYESFDSISSLNESTKFFSLSKTNEGDDTPVEDYSQEGYYIYEIYIVKKSAEVSETEDPVEFIAYTAAPGTFLVTPVLTLPAIEGFEIKDGFKDKVEIRWQRQNDVAYSLERYKINKDGIKEGDVEEVLISDLTPEASTVFVQDSAESGTRYKYTLTASSGKYKVPSIPVTAECLGIPEPVFDAETAKHDSVTISWKKVLKADSYEIDFTDGTSSFPGFPISSQDFKTLPEGITVTEDGNLFICTLNKPAGYDDATVSGKNWNASVNATNSITSDTTAGNVDIFTMGPAAVSDLKVSVAESNSSITVSWKPVPGAKGYAVRRARCDVEAPYKELSVDVYSFMLNDSKVKANGTDVTAAAISISNDKISLIDTYKAKPADNPTSWDKNQDELNWGFPYKYTVFPVLEDEELESEADSPSSFLGDVAYTNSNANEISKLGSCIGYGHKVTATKAEDPKNITVTWTRPFGVSDDLEPYLWYRACDETEWTLNNSKASRNAAGLYSSFVLTPIGNNRTKAFEYAVTYSARNIKPNDSYLENLLAVADENCSPTESLNKGYAFAIDFEAEPVLVDGKPSFSEEFSWKLWDYSKRAVGPETTSNYALCLKNNDFFIKSETDDGWRVIADVDQKGNISTDSYSSSFGSTEYNISVVPGTNKVTVTPLAAKKYNTALDSDKTNEGVYDGLLKIQRDYKHYAKLSVTRSNSKGQNIEASCSDKEEYAYRNLTDGELARMALMTFAYAFYLNDGGNAALTTMGQFKYGEANTIYAALETNDQKGNASFTKRESAATITSNWGKYRHYFTFFNYNASILTPGNETAITPVSISCEKASCMIKGDVDSYVYNIETDPLKLSIKACGEDYSKYPDLLKADLSISVPDNNSITVSVKRNNANSGTEVVSTKDNGTRKWWFPMQIHSDKSYLFTSTDYDWWPKEEN